LNHYVVCG